MPGFAIRALRGVIAGPGLDLVAGGTASVPASDAHFLVTIGAAELVDPVDAEALAKEVKRHVAEQARQARHGDPFDR